MFKRRKKEIYSLISLFVFFTSTVKKKGTSANDKRKTGGKYAKRRTKEK